MELPNASHFFLLLTCTCIYLLCFAESATNETDRLALLAFKGQIHGDPNQVLSSWNDSLHFCMWAGVTCSRRHPQRVTALNITGQSLAGPLSTQIANLSFLQYINLSFNSFHGPIPQELGRLSKLRYLSLYSNSLDGKIPNNLSRCLELGVLSFYENKLVGEIPFELGSLSKLNWLSLGKNNLSGYIPPSFGNLSSLTYLYLRWNSLEGSIPDGIGRLAKLQFLTVGDNKLSGMVPFSLYNISSIKTLDVDSNHLHGSLPPELGLTLPNLEQLYVGGNQFVGNIPVSLGNASMVTHLDFGYNNFSGSMPMNLGRLKGLQWLTVGGNQLGRGNGDDLGFITSLTNCSDLKALGLDQNQFSGALPNSVANLSAQLTDLWLEVNQIFGTIPIGIENLASLSLLVMYDNLLTGTIPIQFGMLSKLVKVYLNQNNLSGQIPTSLGNLTRLARLYLGMNNLHGSIPMSLQNCQHLETFDLSKNNISGPMPKQLLDIPSLVEFSVDMNSLSGSLPLDCDKLKNLVHFDISNNKFSGEFPSTLGNCLGLTYLDIGGNFFQGTIPLSLSALKGVEKLDLSHNNLSGQIPKYLGQLTSLQYLNLSFNNLEGEVPKQGIFQNVSAISILGNTKLCGGIPELQLPTCLKHASKRHGRALSLRAIISGVVIVVVCLFLLLCFLTYRHWLKKSSEKPFFASLMREHFLEVTYAKLLKATDGFSSTNLIGMGSYGFVYKGILDSIETTVAIKVLNLQQRRASRSFTAECNALKSVRHRNVLKILTVCSSIDFGGNEFMALVFKYMPNGSLDTWLHPNTNELRQLRNLNLVQRINIAIDVACALDYLHHHCGTPIVHCDLKPSNILLDDDMVAHVSDFGLARMLSEDVANSSRTHFSSLFIKGSIGYVAPEYGVGSDISTYGDLYSYGIVLLEMLTGKKPTDAMFEDNVSIHQFAKMAFSERVMEIIDHQLLSEEIESIRHCGNDKTMRSGMQECLVSLVRIGISCSVESPKERMELKDVVRELHKVRDFYLGATKYQTKHDRSQLLSEGPSYLSNY